MSNANGTQNSLGGCFGVTEASTLGGTAGVDLRAAGLSDATQQIVCPPGVELCGTSGVRSSIVGNVREVVNSPPNFSLKPPEKSTRKGRPRKNRRNRSAFDDAIEKIKRSKQDK